MRRKAMAKKAPPRGTKGTANSNIKTRETTHLKVVKQIGRPTKTPTGKGLGKAGAKRLGRLLKRAIQDQEETTVMGKVSLPKTPVRLLKHQIQTEAENAPKTNTAKPSLPHVPQLILSLVSHCKHRGGISMAELKQALAAGGYNVTKNNRRVNVVTQRLVNNETLVQTTRNASLKLNNKNQTDTKRVRTSSVKSPKPKGIQKQSKTASKSSKDAEKSKRQVARKTPKPKGRTRRVAAKSRKLTSRTRKPAAKSRKLTSRTRKPAAKSRKPGRKTTKARGKSPKPAGKKRRSATNRAVQVRKAPRKVQRSQRHPYKSSRTRQPPRRRPKTQQRQAARSRAFYY